MRKLLLTFLLLLLTSPISYEASAHNILYLDADAIGSNNNITIRQAETHSELASSGAYFDLGSGSDNTINIDMQGDNSGCCNYITGGFNTNSNSTLTIKMDGSATGHRVELDYDYTGVSNYHHMDIDFSTAYYYQKLYFDDGDVDHSNTSFELDMAGGSTNTVYATIASTQQAIKIDVDGGNNLIYAWVQGVGDLATGRTELYTSNDAATYALWISVTGNNHKIRARSIGEAKTKITVSGSGDHTISQFTIANGWMINNDGGLVDLTIAGSSDNRIGYSGGDGGNIAIIVLNASNQTGASVDLWQVNGNNRFELTVTGSSIHQYTPYWIQTGDQSYCATVNLDNLSSSVSGAQSTGNSGGC